MFSNGTGRVGYKKKKKTFLTGLYESASRRKYARSYSSACEKK